MKPLIAIVQGKLGRFTSFESSMDKLQSYMHRTTGRLPGIYRGSGLNPAKGRNEAVAGFLSDHRDSDCLVFFDDDQVFNSDTVIRLCDMLERGPYDIVAPLILKTDPPFQSVAWQRIDGRLVPFIPWGRTGTHEMAEVGTGILAIKRCVLEDPAVAQPWFQLGQIPGFPDEMMEDVFFCRSATAAGYRIGLDVGYQAGHTAPFTIWPDVEGDCVVIAGGPGVKLQVPSSVLGGIPERQPAAVGL